MAKEDLNNISTNQNNTKPFSLSLTLFLYGSLIFFGIVLLLYSNRMIGALVIITPFAHKFIKKNISVTPIANLIKRIFKTSKSVILFCIVLDLIGLGIIGVNEEEVLFCKKSSYGSVLGGIIWDENTEPLPSVIVFLPEISLTDTTDELGRYLFEIKDTSLKSVTLIAKKGDYKTYETEASVGNTSQNFNLIRK